MHEITIDEPLNWRAVAQVGAGAPLRLGAAAGARVARAHAVLAAILARGDRVYGVNTGVGALCDVAIAPGLQRALSRNIVMSHSCGVGVALGVEETRAIMAAAVNNFAHGGSGLRPRVVERLLLLLDEQAIPLVPAHGSVGYLTHMAHIALVLIGDGEALFRGTRMTGGELHSALGIAPLELEAKEGLSLVNGTPCATGLACVGLARAERALDWADAIAAMTFENIGTNPDAISPEALRFRVSAGIAQVGARLSRFLAGSELLAHAPRRTQDALSLRAIPHVHGAARDVFAATVAVTDRELASVTDNPILAGTPQAPQAVSQAHAVGAALALALDALAIAIAEVAAMSERRIDRLLNPATSGLPAFLAVEGGVSSGLMIAQYTAASLVAQNRRLAQPASLDGGVTSALQEDHLSHATPAAVKLLQIIDNAQTILAIEYLAAVQAYDVCTTEYRRAAATDVLYRLLRERVPLYRDDRPLATDIRAAAELVRTALPADVAAS